MSATSTCGVCTEMAEFGVVAAPAKEAIAKSSKMTQCRMLEPSEMAQDDHGERVVAARCRPTAEIAHDRIFAAFELRLRRVRVNLEIAGATARVRVGFGELNAQIGEGDVKARRPQPTAGDRVRARGARKIRLVRA